MDEPSYLKLHEKGVLQDRVDQALSLIKQCRLCPRNCGVDRLSNEVGFCKTGRRARVASYNPHFGEESPLVGRFGSGTIFFSFCNLLCSFCQNFEISHSGEGVEVNPEDLAAMMITLVKRGCHNINFVTPTHVMPQILEGLIPAVENGLNIPLVYNSSGYDRLEALRILEGIFDIYMPDFKFWNDKWAVRYCKAQDYSKKATSAIIEMFRQVGDLTINEEGIATGGLLVRHLVMPEGISDTKEIMKFLANTISTNTYVNVMDQYRPCGYATMDKFINRMISPEEFRIAVKIARKAGLMRLDLR